MRSFIINYLEIDNNNKITLYTFTSVLILAYLYLIGSFILFILNLHQYKLSLDSIDYYTLIVILAIILIPPVGLLFSKFGYFYKGKIRKEIEQGYSIFFKLIRLKNDGVINTRLLGRLFIANVLIIFPLVLMLLSSLSYLFWPFPHLGHDGIGSHQLDKMIGAYPFAFLLSLCYCLSLAFNKWLNIRIFTKKL